MEGIQSLKGSWPWLWPWFRPYGIPSCITHRPLPIYQISLRSEEKIFRRSPLRQSHVTQKLGKISKIRPDQIYILCSSLRISGHLPAPIVNGGGDRFWTWKEFNLWRARDLDFDLGSGHTAYRRASLIDLYLHTKFHSNRRNFLSTDRLFPYLILLGRLLEVDLKSSHHGTLIHISTCRLKLSRTFLKVLHNVIFSFKIFTT